MAAAALLAWAGNAAALGLGRLQVQSALGESLRAEIEVTSLTPEEEANFRAQIAAPEAYRAAGVDYNPVLPGTRVSLERRSDGRRYLRIVSDRVVQEPFVDMILELSWSAGRLVREYTLLLDPPLTRQASGAGGTGGTGVAAPVASLPAPPPGATAQAPVAPPASQQQADAAGSGPGTGGSSAAAGASAQPPTATAALPASQARSGASDIDEYQVNRGDTLYGIASRVQRSGVSLDQMLVSIYRANPRAFMGDNMNRLKAGSVLTVPSAEEAQAVAPAEARRLIQAQSADFSAYRQRLAAAATTLGAAPSGRQASGQVEAAVEDRRAAGAGSPDRLTLSKGALTPGTPSEEQIAIDRERREADARVAELSRNLQDLKEMAPTAAAPAQNAGPAGAVAGGAGGVPAEAPVPGVQVPLAGAPSEPVPAAASAVAEAPAAQAEAPAPAAPVAAAGPPPPAAAGEEPGLVAQLVEHPMALPAAGGIVALLLGLGLYRLRGRSKKESGETSFLESRLQPDSFFGASGGQRIDTKDASGAPSSLSYSLSQLDAIGDVDPVAEADVYLAYGRDLQAEEILKEAMRTTPERLAIRTKLLEVYAKRRDTAGFEALATQLQQITGGKGEDWARAQELGRQLDPTHPLYQPEGRPVPALAATPAVAAASAGLAGAAGAAGLAAERSVPPPPAAERFQQDLGRVDLNLDLPGETPVPRPASGATRTYVHPPAAPAAAPDLLDLPLDDVPPPAATAGKPMDLDLGDLSLDLDAVDAAAPAQASAATRTPVSLLDDLPGLDLDDIEEGGDPLERKLELAEEFRQIGDRDGARELLQEVVGKSSGALKAKAQTMLAELV